MSSLGNEPTLLLKRTRRFHFNRTRAECCAALLLLLILDCQAAGNTVHLIPGFDFAHSGDLGGCRSPHRVPPQHGTHYAICCATQSRTGVLLRTNFLSSVLVPSPNSRSNATRGFTSAGQRIHWRSPTDAIGVRTAIAPIAIAEIVILLHAELNGFQDGVAAIFLSDELIHRHADVGTPCVAA